MKPTRAQRRAAQEAAAQAREETLRRFNDMQWLEQELEYLERERDLAASVSQQESED